MKNYLGADTVAHEQVPSERIGKRKEGGRTNEKWDPADNFGVTVANKTRTTNTS